jgi:hypothetical protein
LSRVDHRHTPPGAIVPRHRKLVCVPAQRNRN